MVELIFRHTASLLIPVRLPRTALHNHADPKRSRVINSHYQEFKFNYRLFKLQYDHVFMSQSRKLLRKFIFGKKCWMLRFFFGRVYVYIVGWKSKYQEKMARVRSMVLNATFNNI